jgi:hypothetical protein
MSALHNHFGSFGCLLYADGEELGEMAAKTKLVVNLDALIPRADLVSPGQGGDDVLLNITGLERQGMLYPALRKPDFQRETAFWTPEQVAELIATFVRDDLIPAIILWRAGEYVFVIDGAHRLSALIAWAQDDYGDGTVSQKFFQNDIPDEQIEAAKQTRDLVNAAVGSYERHKNAITNPGVADPQIQTQAKSIAWHRIHTQWIKNADHEKAETSFFRINQGGAPIDRIEARILHARRSALALAARAILRGGTGHNYWEKFHADTQIKIEELGKEIHEWLFTPTLSLPLKTLDVPMAGNGYGPHVLPFIFDLVGLLNNVPSSTDEFPEDPNGERTIQYLVNTRAMVWRLCSNHASSLGLHPALYFYSRLGAFQPIMLLSFALLFEASSTDDFRGFTRVRSEIERFMLSHRGVAEAAHRLGAGGRGRPRMVAFFNKLVSDFTKGKTQDQVHRSLLRNRDLSFLIADSRSNPGSADGRFTRETKNAAYLREALPKAPTCPTCGGLLSHNGMQVGHKRHRRDGGPGNAGNAQMQHPFCNSTMDQ